MKLNMLFYCPHIYQTASFRRSFSWGATQKAAREQRNESRAHFYIIERWF